MPITRGTLALPRFGQALADARERGEPFGDAWRHGLRTVQPSSELRVVLAETHEGWQRAYEREPPTPAERAAGELFGVLDPAA